MYRKDAKINTLTVLIMQVPCCMGLLNLARQASEAAQRKVPGKLCSGRRSGRNLARGVGDILIFSTYDLIVPL